MIFAVFQDTCPGSIAIAFNDGVCASEFVRLLRIKCCVNSTEDHKCPLFASQPADFIATQCIARVNSNSNNIPSRNASDIQLLQCFVNDYRVAKAGGCGSGEHIEPARCDDADAEGPVTRIDEADFQGGFLESGMFTIAVDVVDVGPCEPNESPSQAIVTHVLSALN
jgi:hypothetical protein